MDRKWKCLDENLRPFHPWKSVLRSLSAVCARATVSSSLSLSLCVWAFFLQLLSCSSAFLSLSLSLYQFFSTTVTAALCCYPILLNSSCLGVLQHCLQTKAFFSFFFQTLLQVSSQPHLHLPSFLPSLCFFCFSQPHLSSLFWPSLVIM